MGELGADDLRALVREFLATNDPSGDRLEFLRARFDAGLAWVHYPRGLGGLDAPRALQPVVDAEFAAAGAPDNDPRRIGIGLGMAAPTVLVHGTDEQRRRWLRPLWTGEEVWCQLFSEPGAGSDLAALATRAVRDGDDWLISGQKVWTSMAHEARWAIAVTRTDPDVPKHAGLTYFVLDMTAAGVDVRPLRQITGEAEFNEVFLSDVRTPDEQRLGEIGNGWRVAQTTLMNERVAIGGAAIPREGGAIAAVTTAWRSRPELRTPAAHDELMRLWVEAEAARLTGIRLRQQLAAGAPGPEGSAAKLAFARLNQQVSGFELDLLGTDGLRYDDWSTDTWPRSGRTPSTSSAAPPATGTCGPRATRSRAARRRSSARSSPSGCSACPARSASTRTSPGKTCRNDGLGPGAGRHAAKLPAGGPTVTDLLYSEVEDALRASVRDLLADRAPLPAVLKRTETDEPYDPALWQALASDLGVAGLAVPEDRGGQGASWREVAVVAEELGASVAATPFLGSTMATAAARVVRASDLVPPLVSGELTATLVAPLDADPGRWVADVRVGDGTVHGRVPNVIDAVSADVLLVPTEAGLLQVDAAETTRVPVPSLDMTRPLCDVTFDGAGATVLADADGCARGMAAAALVGGALLAAEQLGLARRCLELTVDYVKTRFQFGRAIGSFQALKHRLADLWVAISQAQAVARYAAGCVADHDPDAPVAAALALAYCGPVAVHAAEECLQLHGGIGFTWEHPAHLYLKRAKADAILLGTAAAHRARLAELVDLPAAERA